jgi:tetratricopeptide (TPR) repeat protein
VRAFIQHSVARLAHWLGERGHDTASAGLYRMLAENETDSAQQGYLRHRSLAQAGRLDEAIAELESVIASRADSHHLHHEHGWLLQRVSRHEEAVSAFDRALTDDASDVQSHVARGSSLMALERWTEAEAACRRAIRHEPRHWGAWQNLGLVLAQLERFDEAIDAFRAALAITPSSNSSACLSYVLESLERFAEAETVLRDAIRFDATNPLLLSKLIHVLLEQERTSEALELLATADPRVADNPALIGASVHVLLELNRKDEALAGAQRLVTVDQSAYAETTLAWAHLKAGDLRQAEAAIARAEAHQATEREKTIGRTDLEIIRVAVLSAVGKYGEALALLQQLGGEAAILVRAPYIGEYIADAKRAAGNDSVHRE